MALIAAQLDAGVILVMAVAIYIYIYIIYLPPSPHFRTPSLIILMVSVGVKHHVYLLSFPEKKKEEEEERLRYCTSTRGSRSITCTAKWEAQQQNVCDVNVMRKQAEDGPSPFYSPSGYLPAEQPKPMPSFDFQPALFAWINPHRVELYCPLSVRLLPLDVRSNYPKPALSFAPSVHLLSLNTHTHTHTHTRARTHARTHARARTRTHARTHTHTHTRTYKHTCMHAYIHIKEVYSLN